MRFNLVNRLISVCGVVLLPALLSTTASAAETASPPPELQTNLFQLQAEAEHGPMAVHPFVIGGIIVLLLGAVLVWNKALQWQVQERTRKLETEIRNRQRAEFQQAAEAERSRIARDLHDGLGTGLTELSLLASAGLGQFQEAEKIRNRFDTIAEKARALVSSLDVIVWAIEPKRNSLQSFAGYVGDYARELFSSSAIVFRLRIQTQNDAVALSEAVRHSLFLAVKEALNNVIRHASATEVQLQISQLDARLHIVITDNGRGFDWNTIQRGNGLTNLQERLQAMRGECRFESHPGSGTTVKFMVPLGPAAGPPVDRESDNKGNYGSKKQHWHIHQTGRSWVAHASRVSNSASRRISSQAVRFGLGLHDQKSRLIHRFPARCRKQQAGGLCHR